jgi:hypothetical protein
MLADRWPAIREDVPSVRREQLVVVLHVVRVGILSGRDPGHVYGAPVAGGIWCQHVGGELMLGA